MLFYVVAVATATASFSCSRRRGNSRSRERGHATLERILRCIHIAVQLQTPSAAPV